jgi:hypothetical protein
MPADLTATAFDFDEWASLARSDPEAFERKRRAAIDGLIESAGARNRDRLRGLQWRLDQRRRRAKTPVAACIEIYHQMWDAVLRSGGLLAHLEYLQGQAPAPARPSRSGTISPLTRSASPPDSDPQAR